MARNKVRCRVCGAANEGGEIRCRICYMPLPVPQASVKAGPPPRALPQVPTPRPAPPPPAPPPPPPQAPAAWPADLPLQPADAPAPVATAPAPEPTWSEPEPEPKREPVDASGWPAAPAPAGLPYAPAEPFTDVPIPEETPAGRRPPLVLIVGVVVLVGALIAAIAVFAGGGGSTDAAATSTTETPTTADPHPDWIAFVDPDGSFAAEFPNQPTFTQSLDDVGGGIFLPTKEWLSTDGTTRYAVSRLEMPAGALQLVDAQSLLLESAKTNSDPNATVLTAAPTSIDGDPAVDIALQLANGRYSLGHAIIHRDRIWVVWTESDKPLPEEQAFFLKNFVIVPQ